MNRSELVDELAKRFDGNRKVAQHALDSVVEVITRSVAAGERVVITGFGAFERGVREAGTARNPRTGQVVKTPRRFVPKFRPGSDLKKFVNDARALPKRMVDSLAVVPATAARAARAAAAGERAEPTRRPAERKAAAKKAPPKKAAAKKAPPKKAAAKKAPAKQAPTKKSAAKKASAEKATTKKTTAKKTTTKKTTGKKTTAKKA